MILHTVYIIITMTYTSSYISFFNKVFRIFYKGGEVLYTAVMQEGYGTIFIYINLKTFCLLNLNGIFI